MSTRAKRGRPPRPQMVRYDWSKTPPVFGVNLFERMLHRAARPIGKSALHSLGDWVRDHAPEGDSSGPRSGRTLANSWMTGGACSRTR